MGQLSHYYGQCSLTDGVFVLIYSLLSRKFKWHGQNNQDAKLLMFRLLTELTSVSSVLSNTILCVTSSDPKQNGDFFSKCCFAELKCRNSPLEEMFLPEVFCQGNSSFLFSLSLHYI